MNEFIESIAPGAVSVLVALLVGATGYMIAGFNESKRWQRQQRIALYREITKYERSLVLDIKNYLEQQKSHYNNYPQENDYSSDNYAYMHSVEHINNTSRKLSKRIKGSYKFRYDLEIIGSTKAQKLYNTYLDLLITWVGASFDGNTKNEERSQQKKAWSKFIDQAQRDLGLKHWWNPGP